MRQRPARALDRTSRVPVEREVALVATCRAGASRAAPRSRCARWVREPLPRNRTEPRGAARAETRIGFARARTQATLDSESSSRVVAHRLSSAEAVALRPRDIAGMLVVVVGCRHALPARPTTMAAGVGTAVQILRLQAERRCPSSMSESSQRPGSLTLTSSPTFHGQPGASAGRNASLEDPDHEEHPLARRTSRLAWRPSASPAVAG